MEGLVGRKSLPPGFRFHPTDEELFMYYLKRKVLGKRLSPEMIAEVDVYRFPPWDLPPMASLKTRDLMWYFFCPRARKYPNGGRANRATEDGYWKSTGNDRTMMYNTRSVGKIKTLIFHQGKAPKGDRTDWVMHEYRLEDRVLAEKGVCQDCFVICKIYKKSGVGPRNGENYGARFVEEEWDDDDDDDNVQVQERGIEVVPIPVNVDPRWVGDSPDGSISALTVSIPTAIDMGRGRVGDSPDGSVSALTATVVTPNAVSSVELPAAIFMAPLSDAIRPDVQTAFVDTPFATAYTGNPPATDSMGTLNVCAGSTSDATAFVANDLDENELDMLLATLTEDDESNIFSGLEDLGYLSGQYDLSCCDHISMDDLK